MDNVELTEGELKEFLSKLQGKVITYRFIRTEMGLKPGGKSWNNLRPQMARLVEEKIVRPTGRNPGEFKVVSQANRVIVFDKEREASPEFELIFPRDYDTMEEMLFAGDIILREGDAITVGGVSNYGKTTVALSFCGENIDQNPVLMGHEYTTMDEQPTPRLINRLSAMDWIQWTNGDGTDKFELLPVREDYAEHIVKDRINIIDWVNLDANQLYNISQLMQDMKREVGKGILIIVLQKGEGAGAPRGGQFAKDFTDCELLLDKLGNYETLLTIGKVKEYRSRVMGRTFGFEIANDGVRILNFREVVRCKCWGKKDGCECLGKGYLDK